MFRVLVWPSNSTIMIEHPNILQVTIYIRPDDSLNPYRVWYCDTEGNVKNVPTQMISLEQAVSFALQWHQRDGFRWLNTFVGGTAKTLFITLQNPLYSGKFTEAENFRRNHSY